MCDLNLVNGQSVPEGLVIRPTVTFAWIFFKAYPGLRSLFLAIHWFEVAHDRTQRTLGQLFLFVSSYVVLKLFILSRAIVVAVNVWRCFFCWRVYLVNVDSPFLLWLAFTSTLFLITLLFTLDRLQIFLKLLLCRIIRVVLTTWIALLAPGSAVVMAVPRKRAASTRTGMSFLV